MHYLYKIILIIILSLSLFACSRINQENFNKLNNNMSMQEVIAILGEPSSSESVNIAGISGTASVWKNKNARIEIQFINDKLIAKTFSKNKD